MVRIEFGGEFARGADREESVAGWLELIGGGENVGGLDARMNEAIAVEINEGIEHRFEHGASFGIPERTLGNNLGKVFLGVLHDHVETIPVLEAAAADGEDCEQMGMNKLHGAAPQRALEVGGRTGGEGV